jgi:hypothetical protein
LLRRLLSKINNDIDIILGVLLNRIIWIGFCSYYARMSIDTSVFERGTDGMISSQTLNRLTLALIELQYAAADCARREPSTAEPLEVADLEALLSKLTEASRMVQFAISELASQSGNGPPKPSHDEQS